MQYKCRMYFLLHAFLPRQSVELESCCFFKVLHLRFAFLSLKKTGFSKFLVYTKLLMSHGTALSCHLDLWFSSGSRAVLESCGIVLILSQFLYVFKYFPSGRLILFAGISWMQRMGMECFAVLPSLEGRDPIKRRCHWAFISMKIRVILFWAEFWFIYRDGKRIVGYALNFGALQWDLVGITSWIWYHYVALFFKVLLKIRIFDCCSWDSFALFASAQLLINQSSQSFS